MNDSRNETSKAIKPIKLLEGKNDKLFKLKTSIFFLKPYRQKVFLEWSSDSEC